MQTMLHKLRTQRPYDDTRPEDEEAERDKLRRAQYRLRVLDLRADIIARRSGKTHE